MTPESRDVVTWLLGVAISGCILIGLATRYVLIPYLRDHLIKPLQETHEQVTMNSHTSPGAPTLPDRMEDLRTDVRTLTRLLDMHVTWSLAEHQRIDSELQQRITDRENDDN